MEASDKVVDNLVRLFNYDNKLELIGSIVRLVIRSFVTIGIDIYQLNL